MPTATATCTHHREPHWPEELPCPTPGCPAGTEANHQSVHVGDLRLTSGTLRQPRYRVYVREQRHDGEWTWRFVRQTLN